MAIENMTLRGFLTRLIWFSILPLLLVGSLLAIDHLRSQRRYSADQAQRLAHQVAAAVDRQLSGGLGALRALAASPLVDDPQRWRELHAQALALSQVQGFDVVLAGRDRQARLHTRVPWGETIPPPPAPTGRSALQQALASGEQAVSDLFTNRFEPHAMVGLAVPVVRRGQVALVMYGAMPASQLATTLAEVPLPPGWSLALHDSVGQVVAGQGPGADAEGASFQAATTLAPWTVRLALSSAQQRQPVLEAAAMVFAALLGATVTGVLGGRWAAGRLARAVGSLAASGHAAAPVDEITEIAAARRQLALADQARDHAESARRDGEARHLISMEQATLALQVREGLLRGVFDSATDAILTANAQQEIVMANPAAARLFGWPLEQLVGLPLVRLIPERHRATHEHAVHAFGETGVTARQMGQGPDLAGLRADGSEFPIDVAISHVHVDGQRLYTAILRDITERRRAEQALRDSRAKLAAALQSMNDAVFIADGAGRIVEFNDAFAAFHRFSSREECLRMLPQLAAVLELRQPEGATAPPAQWPLARALQGESASLADYTLRRIDSGESWIGSFSFAPIRDGEGRIVGAVATARDITGLRRVRAELEASHAELRRLVAAQDGIQEAERKRIARELHDDLQQTLAAVLMETTAARAAAAAAPPPLLEALDTIDRLATAAIASTRRIVNDLRPQMLEELGLVPALEAMAARFAERSGVACRVQAEGLAPADERRADLATTCLYRVAQEALNNVAKHSGARQVAIRLARPLPGRLRLQVQDDGRGLAPQDRHKPESFGLLGMRERVRAAGGTLRVLAEPGAGTTVEAEVPVP